MPFVCQIYIAYSAYDFQYYSTTNNAHLFGNWLNEIVEKNKSKNQVGVYPLLWAIWNVRNVFILRNIELPQFFAGYPFGRVWSFLQMVERKMDMVFVCNCLKMYVEHISTSVLICFLTNIKYFPHHQLQRR